MTVDPNPDDRASIYSALWAAWAVAFFVIEFKAIYDDSRNQDRVKRTLTSNIRYVFATDSVTGIPLNVKHGKLRRFTLITILGWFEKHFERQDFV